MKTRGTINCQSVPILLEHALIHYSHCSIVIPKTIPYFRCNDWLFLGFIFVHILYNCCWLCWTISVVSTKTGRELFCCPPNACLVKEKTILQQQKTILQQQKKAALKRPQTLHDASSTISECQWLHLHQQIVKSRQAFHLKTVDLLVQKRKSSENPGAIINQPRVYPISPWNPWVNLFVATIERLVLAGLRTLRRAAVRVTIKIEDLQELKACSQSSPRWQKSVGLRCPNHEQDCW